MNPGQRMEMLDDKKRLLQAKNDEYKELVFTRATAEYQYNVAFATQLVAERLDGTPITIAKELTKGNRAVAKLKMDYEVQMGIERACLESMRDIREAIGADRSILTWLREEKGQG
jgi:beta-xylosidase